MEKIAVTVLLLTALVAPIVLFLLLRSRWRLNDLVAAAIAVAVGWALNVAYFFFDQEIPSADPSQVNGDNLSIAAYFGWACPAVLVFLTWLVWRFATRNSEKRATRSG